MRDGGGRWRTIEHTADLAVEVEASSLEGVFITAAAALIGLLMGEEEGGPGDERQLQHSAPPVVHKEIAVEAPDRETLLVDWLRELLYVATGEEPLLFVGAEIGELSETRLLARVTFADSGLAAGVERELKGVTYHDLEVSRRGGGWGARVVFDV